VVRLLDYLMAFVSLLTLPFILWWGINQSPQSAAALEAKLETAANAALQRAGVDWARAEMNGQRAILTGAAPSQDAAEEAARIVLRSSGLGGILMGGVSQVESRVQPAEPVRPYVWSVTRTEVGGFILAGYVPSRAVRDALLLEARAAARGPVEDRMVTAPGAPGGNWQGIARFAIVQAAELSAGTAVLSDLTLTLKGDASDDAVRAQVTKAVAGIAAPFRGVALIRGTPLWAATVSGGGMVLSGAVPSEPDRRALMALARQAFQGEVRDEMTVAGSPAEGWISGAKAGLFHMGAFKAGTMAFDPAINGFTFEGTANPSTLYFLNVDMARSAGRWRYMIAAEPMPSEGRVSAHGEELRAACEARLNAVLASGALKPGRGGAGFDRSSAEELDQIAEAARQCGPGADIEITAEGGDAAESRAAELAEFLAHTGVQRPRLAAIGYGSVGAGEGMDTGAAVNADQLLKITVRERSGQ
jgi:hypothetical protein